MISHHYWKSNMHKVRIENQKPAVLHPIIQCCSVKVSWLRNTLILLKLYFYLGSFRVDLEKLSREPFNVRDNFSQGLPDYCISRLALFLFHSNRFREEFSRTIRGSDERNTRAAGDVLYFRKYENVCALYIVLRSLVFYKRHLCYGRDSVVPSNATRKSASRDCTRGRVNWSNISQSLRNLRRQRIS